MTETNMKVGRVTYLLASLSLTIVNIWAGLLYISDWFGAFFLLAAAIFGYYFAKSIIWIYENGGL